LSLQTETDHASARALYAAVGFQPVDGLERLNLAPVPKKAQRPRTAVTHSSDLIAADPDAS
jgi:hypothetical protein